MSKNTIIGLKNTVNFDYQKSLHEKTKQIMGNKDEISVAEFKSGSVFNQIAEKLDNEIKNALVDKISAIAGDDNKINKIEMKAILMLLDANLEEIKNNALHYVHGLNVSKIKFVIDNEINVSKSSGIFQATDNEIYGLKKVAEGYDFDNGECFADMQSDGSWIYYDKDKNNLDIRHTKNDFKNK